MTDPTNPVSPPGEPALDLGGRRALVTGGAPGIRAAVAALRAELDQAIQQDLQFDIAQLGNNQQGMVKGGAAQ